MTANDTVTAAVETELERRGWNRLQLATTLGKTPSYVTKKLNGKLRWSMDDLDLVSDRLGVPLAVLLMAPVERATQRCRTLVRCVTRRYHTLASHASLVSVPAAA